MSLRKKIREDIDYGDYPERISPGVERSISDPESLYAKNPAMKRGAQDVEDLIVSRFKDVVDHLRNVTNIPDLSSRQIQGMLYNEMMGRLVPQAIQIEDQHKEQLEQLAISEALIEAEVPADWFEIEATLIRGQIDSSQFRQEPEDVDDEDDDEEEKPEQPNIPSFDLEDLTDEEIFELEKHKRNLINALIQGFAKKAHHLYLKESVKLKLDEIDSRLFPLYKKIMAITDFMYFVMGDEVDAMAQGGHGIAGISKLDDADSDEDGGGGDEGGEDGEQKPDTKIIAQGLMFPILSHEIVKGLKEASGRHGLPKNTQLAKKVMGQTDLLRNEPMQLRMGPKLQERFRMMLPNEMFEDSNSGLAPWFEMVLYQIDAKEILEIFANVVSKNTEKNNLAKAKFVEVMKEAVELKEEYDQYKKDNNIPPDDDDSLRDFLNDMGIDLPQ